MNQLTSVKVWAVMTSESGSLNEMFEGLNASIDHVAGRVSDLSEEQLDTWQLRYANSDAHHFDPSGAYA